MALFFPPWHLFKHAAWIVSLPFFKALNCFCHHKDRSFYLLHKSEASVGKSRTASGDLNGWELESSGSFFTHMSDLWAGGIQVWLHLEPLTRKSISGLCIRVGPSLNKAAMAVQDSKKQHSREQGERWEPFHDQPQKQHSVTSVILYWSKQL